MIARSNGRQSDMLIPPLGGQRGEGRGGGEGIEDVDMGGVGGPGDKFGRKHKRIGLEGWGVGGGGGGVTSLMES